MISSVEKIIDQVSPNLQSAVRFLWNHGFETTDSGDGTNFENGMEGAIPYDHVAIQMQDNMLSKIPHRTEELQVLLDRNGCGSILVEATYFPRERICIILVSDPEKTGQLRNLGV